MTPRQLEIFIAIVEEGSLTRAAERVHTVQPALTQQIKVLEDEFGVPLLVRSSRGVRPTEAGQRLVVHGRALLAQFAALRAQVLGTDAQPSGEVRVGVPATASAVVSPRLIAAIAAAYPQVRLRIVEPMAGLIVDWIDQARVDFAISYRGSHPRGVELETVLTERIDLCCSARSPMAETMRLPGPIPFEQACQLPLILPHRGYSSREILESHARQLGCKLNVSIEIDSIGPTRSLLDEGFGFAFLPPMATMADREQGLLLSRPVHDPPVERTVYLASLSDRPLSVTAAAVRAVCRRVLAELVRGGVWEARLDLVD